MIKQRIRIGAVISAMVLFGASCAMSKVTKAWQSPNAKQAELKKVLVVAVIPQEVTRRNLEDGLARELSQRGVTAVEGHQYVQDGQSLTAEQLKEIGEQAGVDGVLVARYAGTKVDVDYWPAYGYGYAYPDYYRHTRPFYGYPFWGGWDVTETSYIDVRLFDAKDSGVLLWTASAKTTDPEGAATPTKLAKRIVDRMEKDMAI